MLGCKPIYTIMVTKMCYILLDHDLYPKPTYYQGVVGDL